MVLSKEKEQKYLKEVQKAGWKLGNIKEDEQTTAICLEAVKKDGRALEFVKKQIFNIC